MHSRGLPSAVPMAHFLHFPRVLPSQPQRKNGGESVSERECVDDHNAPPKVSVLPLADESICVNHPVPWTTHRDPSSAALSDLVPLRQMSYSSASHT